MKKLIALLLTVVMITALAACGGSGTSAKDNDKVEESGGNVASSADDNDNQVEESDMSADDDRTEDNGDDETTQETVPEVNITQTPAQSLMESMTEYEDVNGCFTATIPEGWAVSTAGYDMLYWIRIYDPNNPDLQVFTLLKTECLLMDQNSKAFYENLKGYELYAMFADMIVVEKVEDFYKQFMEFCSFMATYEPTYSGFEYPQINSFETLETFEYGSLIASEVFEDSMIHGTYMDNYTGQQGEGMFTGSLCRGFESMGVGCNMMYNINAVTAPYGEFAEYEELLTTIFSTIQYTDTFTSTVMNDLQIKAEAAAQLNTTLQETSGIITQGWSERQKTYDLISEKQSDATLGYERVYDVETGEIYKAYNGFSDISGIDQYYLPITDDMYSEPITGYIEK